MFRTIISDSLRLDGLSALPDLLCHVVNLHDRVGLDYPKQVLFEECVIQRREVGANRWIR